MLRKNCAKTSRPSSDARPAGAVALAEQDLVEDGQDQREQHERRGHEVRELEAGQHEGREPVEQPPEEGGRRPGRPAPEDDRTR